MEFSDGELKRAADTKLWIESKINGLQEEIDNLREVLQLMNSAIRTSSFKPASDIKIQEQNNKIKEVPLNEFKETRSLKRVNDEFLLGNAYISDKTLAIIPSSNVKLGINIRPFKSFLIDRIYEGMKKKDNEEVSRGKLHADDAINYKIEEEGGIIDKILIENYRDNIRLNEIINTSIWAFTRMLEKEI